MHTLLLETFREWELNPCSHGNSTTHVRSTSLPLSALSESMHVPYASEMVPCWFPGKILGQQGSQAPFFRSFSAICTASTLSYLVPSSGLLGIIKPCWFHFVDFQKAAMSQPDLPSSASLFPPCSSPPCSQISQETEFVSLIPLCRLRKRPGVRHCKCTADSLCCSS